LQDGWPTGVNYQALRPEEIPELRSSSNFRKFQQLIRSAARNVECDVGPEEYGQQLKAEAEEIIQAWHDSKNDLSQGLKEILFGEALPIETLKTVSKAKAPDTSDFIGHCGICSY
jgi:hypothetical protein